MAVSFSTGKDAELVTDLVEKGAWPELFRLLEKCKDPALLNFVADVLYEPGSDEMASVLAETHGFHDLANVFRAYESKSSASPAAMRISVILASGEALLSDLEVSSSLLVLDLVELATASLPGGIQGSISKLCTAEGRVLEAASSLADAGLTPGCVLTASLLDHDLSLDLIEQHFLDFILLRSGYKGCPERLIEQGFSFPSLRKPVSYIHVPGIYGGFSVDLKKEDCGWLLRCRSLSQDHEITAAGIRLVQ
eukprot:TRINITY_DN6880_c0_g1_i1.p1 TRINITY_DN6880_c0_g1~~TRINITY_DN6880_c0_g1_i1.p1  ORF type:complete len:251 (-),score=29.16 TRINITY_DN6880_c0_g1_i1:353-1105(-)